MEHQLTWTKGLFDSSYQIFKDGKFATSLLFETWQSNARTFGSEASYTFKTEGFTNPQTKIYNQQNEIIGIINYKSWQTAALVNMNNGEQFSFNFTNMWQGKWMITDSKQKQVNYDAGTTSGSLWANNEDEVMILTGLFIKEYYTKVLFVVILLIIFVPIICGNRF